ncbi:exosortase F system-associated protein [Gangjinia marincola]|uniref:Exosortase F system-associated protein n=1 Tax=Gangjinia marincola TaxID=578463 RepID=A0ABN1MGV4_9FLAO
MSKQRRIILILIGFSLLAAVRYFEDVLFYDPFIAFFKRDYLQLDTPVYSKKELLIHITWRFFLNMLISLGILYVAFFKKQYIKLSLLLYASAYLILIGLYTYLITFPDKENYLKLFYTRRFLIQPIFLLILLPAFYYQFKVKEGLEIGST